VLVSRWYAAFWCSGADLCISVFLAISASDGVHSTPQPRVGDLTPLRNPSTFLVSKFPPWTMLYYSFLHLATWCVPVTSPEVFQYLIYLWRSVCLISARRLFLWLSFNLVLIMWHVGVFVLAYLHTYRHRSHTCIRTDIGVIPAYVQT